MRFRLHYSFLVLLICVIPFVVGTNASDALLVDTVSNETITQAELFNEILSNDSTTDFDEFLDKEYGVYYEVLDDEPVTDTESQLTNTTSAFTNTSDVIVIENELSDFDSVYISIDEFETATDSNPTFVVNQEDVLVFGQGLKDQLKRSKKSFLVDRLR